MTVTLHELEEAINHWRARHPSTGETLRLCAEAAALAEPYAWLILAQARELPESALSDNARAALDGWRAAAGVHPMQNG